MARLAIDKDFLDDYSKLPKPVQNSVKTAIDKFAEHVHARLHLEKINRCKDDRIRTIRIDQSILARRGFRGGDRGHLLPPQGPPA